MKNNVRVFVYGAIVAIITVAFIVSCNGGGTTPGGPTDTDDQTPLGVVQTIPPDDSGGIDPASIISIFFDDAIIASTVNSSTIRVTLEPGGTTITGQYFVTTSQAGNAIVIFVPTALLPVSSEIKVSLPSTGGVQDDGGNTLLGPEEFSFNTGTATADLDSNNFSFELGTTGLSFTGDCARLGSQGEILPSNGSNMVAVSTDGGFGGVVSASPALFSTTSIFNTGAINASGKQTLKFDYNFVSAEFDEWVGSEFDDTFVVAIRGSSGITSEVVTSVNIIGLVGNTPITLPAGWISADSMLADAGKTDWITKSIDISALGSPIYISFVASDVGDDAYSTIVFIDNIQLP